MKLDIFFAIGLVLVAFIGIFTLANSIENSSDYVQVNCPEDAPVVSYEEALAIMTELNGSFQDGCLSYYVGSEQSFALVEGEN